MISSLRSSTSCPSCPPTVTRIGLASTATVSDVVREGRARRVIEWVGHHHRLRLANGAANATLKLRGAVKKAARLNDRLALVRQVGERRAS